MLLVLWVGMPHRAAAQTGTTGTIVGTVTDESGAVIPGATVDVVDQATNAERSTRSARASACRATRG